MLFKQLNPKKDPCCSYLIGEEFSRKVIFIDPKLKHLYSYMILLKHKDYKLSAVIDTHIHTDYISAGFALHEITGCKYIMHESSKVKKISTGVKDGFKGVISDKLFIEIIHTPGHSEESICIICENKIFTGDVLLIDRDGIGRCDTYISDMKDMYKSLEKLKNINNELKVYPTHMYSPAKNTTLYDQKKRNEYFKVSTYEEFESKIKDNHRSIQLYTSDIYNANINCTRDKDEVIIPEEYFISESQKIRGSRLNNNNIKYIFSADLSEKLISTSPPVVVDLREKSECKHGLRGIEGSLNIPISNLENKLNVIDRLRYKEVVLICDNGIRSGTAAKILMLHGYDNIFVLKDGLYSYEV